MAQQKKNIVTIGGGGGQSAVVAVLKDLPVNLTALTNTADNGGGSGRMMEQYGVAHPGEPLRVLMALGDERGGELSYRFESGELKGQTIGNIVLGGLELALGSQQAAIDRLGAMIGAQHSVSPITDVPLTLYTQTQSGKKIEGQRETVIQIRTHTDDPITSIAIKPADVSLGEKAKAALQEADVIIISMGDLFSSVGPTFCIPEFNEILASTSAQVIWLPNAAVTPGHIQYNQISGALAFLQQYAPAFQPDIIVAHDGTVSDELQNQLQETGYGVSQIDIESSDDCTVLASDLIGEMPPRIGSASDIVDRSPLQYSTERLIAIFKEILL